jgi:hypothetical protein
LAEQRTENPRVGGSIPPLAILLTPSTQGPYSLEIAKFSPEELRHSTPLLTSFDHLWRSKAFTAD